MHNVDTKTDFFVSSSRSSFSPSLIFSLHSFFSFFQLDNIKVEWRFNISLL